MKQHKGEVKKISHFNNLNKCICKVYRQQPSREGIENSFTYLPGDIYMFCFWDFHNSSFFTSERGTN